MFQKHVNRFFELAPLSYMIISTKVGNLVGTIKDRGKLDIVKHWIHTKKEKKITVKSEPQNFSLVHWLNLHI